MEVEVMHAQRRVTVARALGFAIGLALLVLLGWTEAHWHPDQQAAWNTSGPWFVMSWVLAAIGVISAMFALLNPSISWTSVTCGALGVCMIVIAAMKATADDGSELYVPLLFACAQSLLALGVSLPRIVTAGRMSQTALLLTTSLLIACTLGIVALWLNAPPPEPMGFVEELHALDDGAVLVWWMDGADYSGSRGWVSRVDLKGHTVWRSSMPDEALVGDSIAVGDGIVTVRYTHRTSAAPFGTDQAAVAYSLGDGRRLWDRTLTTLDPSENERIEASLNGADNAIFVGNRLVEFAESKRVGDRALILDAATGSVRSQLDWRDMSRSLLIGTRVIQHDFDKAFSLDVETGTARGHTTLGAGCVVGDEYVTIDGDIRDHVSLVGFMNGDLSKRRVIKESFSPVSAGVYFRLVKCGVYGGRIVLSIHRSHPDELGSDTLIVITTPSGDILHELTLPNDLDIEVSEVTHQYYERSSLAGQLPRFAPYIYNPRHSGDEQHEYHLVMVDLENGTIAWQSAADERLLGARLFRDRDQWYLVYSAYQFDVTVLDGGTGRLTHAAVADASDGSLALKPPHVGGGRLWTAADGHRRINRAPVAVLDARSLQTIFAAPEIKLRDITSSRLRELGLQ